MGHVSNVSRRGVLLKGLSSVDNLSDGDTVSVRIIVEDIDPLKPAELVTLTGKIRRIMCDHEQLNLAIVFDSPFPLGSDGWFSRQFRKLAAVCFTERPRY